MVRLKEESLNDNQYHRLYFNSTMVRLKELEKVGNPYVYKFQFHYGTIKRRGREDAGNNGGISIPLWYD